MLNGGSFTVEVGERLNMGYNFGKNCSNMTWISSDLNSKQGFRRVSLRGYKCFRLKAI